MPSEIADDSPGLRPYLLVDGAAQAIEWYEKALGARERYRLATPDHKIAHAELELGDSVLMLCDPLPQFEGRPPTELGSTSVQVFMYVEDVDAAVKRAVDAGATRGTEVTDQFWGDTTRNDRRPVRSRVGARNADGEPDPGGDHGAGEGGGGDGLGLTSPLIVDAIPA